MPYRVVSEIVRWQHTSCRIDKVAEHKTSQDQSFASTRSGSLEVLLGRIVVGRGTRKESDRNKHKAPDRPGDYQMLVTICGEELGRDHRTDTPVNDWQDGVPKRIDDKRSQR